MREKNECKTSHDERIAPNIIVPIEKQVHRSVETIPFKARRRQIAKNMCKSIFTIPHVSNHEDIDMTELLALREQLKKVSSIISITAFLSKRWQFASMSSRYSM